MRSIFLLALLASSPALAEGGRIVLPCTVDLTCDAFGTCTPDGTELTFEITPAEIGGGSVAYALTYDGFEGLAQLDALNTVIWGLGEADVQRLMPTGRNSALWLSQEFGGTPVSTVRFLACEDIQ